MNKLVITSISYLCALYYSFVKVVPPRVQIVPTIDTIATNYSNSPFIFTFKGTIKQKKLGIFLGEFESNAVYTLTKKDIVLSEYYKPRSYFTGPVGYLITSGFTKVSAPLLQSKL